MEKNILYYTKNTFMKIILVLSLVSAFYMHAVSVTSAAPVGVPALPFVSPSIDNTLDVHALTKAPSPLDNPLKGFVPFYPWPTQGSFPHSMEWLYVPLKAVMNGPDSFSFDSGMETQLNEIAARGKQAAVRIYLEYPGRESAIPDFIAASGVAMRNNATYNQLEPNYDDPKMVTYLKNFIAAFGAKYDGDPRIGFIHMGLVGLWGEWHTYPYDDDTSDGLPNYMPSDATVDELISAYDTAFNQTKLELRYPKLHNAVNHNIGYHDDSFGYKEGSPLKSVTQPESMGGTYYSLMTQMLNAGAENKWITETIGGEVRPEIQNSFFSGGSSVDNAIDDIELSHATWMINQGGISNYSANDAAVAEGVRKMGYDLFVDKAYYNNVPSGAPLKVGVSIQNQGVAPFSYPWKVKLGVKDQSGNIIKAWDTSWDLTKVLPLQIRTYPEWNIPGNPKYIPFGQPYYYDTTIALPELADGYYSLVMKVVNPLEAVSSSAKKLRFANAEQNTDGWLNLGNVLIGDCSSPCTAPTTPPATTPTNPSETYYLETFDDASLWSHNSNSVGKWTEAKEFENGPGGTGVINNGALVLQYNKKGWFSSDINMADISKFSTMIIRMKGAVGGEENDISVNIGGASKTLAAFSGATLTTSYKDLSIDLNSNGINRNAMWNVALSFSNGHSGTVYIDDIRFTDSSAESTPTPTPTPTPTSTPTPTPTPGAGSAVPSVIDDFESYTDDAALQAAWTEAWSDVPGSVARTIDTVNHSNGSKALKLSVTDSSATWANIQHPIPIANSNWSGYDGVTFWVDNTTTNDKAMNLNIALLTPVQNGEFNLKTGGSAMISSAVGGWEAAAFDGGSLHFAANYKGMVRIPWDQFVQASWQCNGDQTVCNAELDPSHIDAFQFGYNPSEYAGNVVSIDELGLWRAEKSFDDFESYANNAELQAKWPISWSDVENSVTRTIDTVNYSNGSKALKLTVANPSASWANIQHLIAAEDRDWSGYDGVTFWIDNTTTHDTILNLSVTLLTDAGKGEFSLKSDGSALISSAVGGWETSAFNGGSLVIAANYKGMVRIPWDQFVQASWQCGGDQAVCNAELDPSKGLGFQVGYNPSLFVNNVISMDELGLFATTGRKNEDGTTTPTSTPVPRPQPPAWAKEDGTHVLQYKQAPIDNPLKGFMPFYDASEEAFYTVGDNWRDSPSQMPYSMEFFYMPLNKIMSGPDQFNWDAMDKRIADIASRGHQAVFRIYLDYPNKESGIPQFLLDEGLQTHSYTSYLNGTDATSLAPNYDDPHLMAALETFIKAVGQRYDGDSRIGFIMAGLIGFWGEWHTYPYDGTTGGNPNWMPSNENLKRVLTAMDAAFNNTKLVMRYPMANAAFETKNFDIGYHDDSFAFETLPLSMGGQNWEFWGRTIDAGATEFWKTQSMGGEVRPEIQVKMWNHNPPIYNEPSQPIDGKQGEDYNKSVNLTHVSWLINQGVFQVPLDSEPLARAKEGSRSIGYEYYVPAAYLDASDGSLKVGMEIQNNGVAPFYYKWKVELAAKTGNSIVKIWEPQWDLRGVLPNDNGFNHNKLFESVTNPALSNGNYQILLRFVNPLTEVNADANKFYFANEEQDGAGWLNLGSVDVTGSSSQAPVRVADLTVRTTNQISLILGSSTLIGTAIVPVNASNKELVWTSADNQIAYVSSNGLVTGVGQGQTTIKAKSSDGNIEKTFLVTVLPIPIPVTSISVTGAANAEAIINGSSLQMSAAVLPANASNKKVTWSVAAATGGATINEAGVLTATGIGTVTVTATAQDGSGIAGTRVITVTSPPRETPTSVTTPLPTSAPSPTTDKDVLKEVKLGEDAGTSIQGTDENGKLETIVTMDAKKLKEAFDLLKNRDIGAQTIVIDVKNSGGTAIIKLPASAFIDAFLNTPNANINVQTDLGSYRMPIKVLDMKAIAQSLGANAQDITIQVVIEKVTGAAADQMSTAIKGEGLTLLTPGLDFSITAQANGKTVIVNNFGSTYVERSIIIPQSIDSTKATAVLYDPEKGTLSFVPATFKVVGGTTEVVMKRNGNSIYTVVSNSKSFSDVGGNWAKDDIDLLASKTIIHGISGTHFAPDASITRAEFTAILIRSLGITPANTTADFSDIANEDWYADAVAAAVKAKLVEGYTDGTFKPNEPITREQMAVMFSRALKYVGKSVNVTDKQEQILGNYTDKESISSWAKTSLAELIETNIIQGKTNASVAPSDLASRAESAVMIKRFLQYSQFIN